MEINNKSVEEFYETINEEERLKRQNVNKIEFITTTHYVEKVIKLNSKILDACAGAGIYSFYFAEKGHQVYSGDLVEKNVECIKNNELNSKKIKEIFVGSILDLSKYEDESFDSPEYTGIDGIKFAQLAIRIKEKIEKTILLDERKRYYEN